MRTNFYYTLEDKKAGRIFVLRTSAILTEKWRDAEYAGCFYTFEEALEEAKKHEKGRKWQIKNVETGKIKTGGHALWRSVKCEPND